MSALAVAAVSLVSGLLGSLGLGAGAVLLLYLRVFAGVEQFAAQGINLIFFIPIASFSIILHARNHMIEWKTVALCAISGLPGVFLGVWLGNFLGGELVSKLFAALLLVIGVRELLKK